MCIGGTDVFNDNKYGLYDSQIYDIETGQIVDKEEIKKALQQDVYDKFINNYQDTVDLGIDLDLKLVKDKKGNTHQAVNVKEKFHFVKVFKVDVRDILQSCDISIFSRGFLYTSLAYLNFPTNTLIIDGETPSNEVICEKFGLGKTKLYEVYKELEKADVIKRKKINGQPIIYFNPFLHSCGLVDKDTYKLFEDSLYNPIKRNS